MLFLRNHLGLQKKTPVLRNAAFGLPQQPPAVRRICRMPMSNVFDIHSVRRGAEYYVSYCIGCHSVKHLRYSRFADDYGLS